MKERSVVEMAKLARSIAMLPKIIDRAVAIKEIIDEASLAEKKLEDAEKERDIYMGALNTINSDDIIVSSEECARIALEQGRKLREPGR